MTKLPLYYQYPNVGAITTENSSLHTFLPTTIPAQWLSSFWTLYNRFTCLLTYLFTFSFTYLLTWNYNTCLQSGLKQTCVAWSNSMFTRIDLKITW